jgi:glycerophosphodiester phosphodiesterase
MNSVSLTPAIKRVSSTVRIGYPEHDAVEFDNSIVNDNAAQLSTHLDSLPVDERFSNVLVKLLQRAVNLKSLACIGVLLKKVTTLQETNDLYERNILHKYITNFGRSKAMSSVPATPDSEKDEAFFITPAVTSRASSPTRLGRSTKPKEELDDIAILRILLEGMPTDLRSSLVARDFSGRMPLHYGTFYGLYKACELVASYMREWGLIQDPLYWDDAIWEDSEGLTPLHLAVMGSHQLTLKALLDAENRDPFSNTIRKVSGQPVLNFGVKEDAKEVVEQLIRAGMDLSFQDSNGETALHHACRLGHLEVVKSLLAGSDIQECNLEVTERTFGWTPLFVAAVEGYTAIVDLLVEAGAETDRTDTSGWYAHEHAFFRGHLECGRRIFPAESPALSSVISRTGSPDSLSKSPHTSKQPDHPLETVKSFGHRYLVGKSMVVVTLGSTDVRKPTSTNPITLDTLPLTKAIPTHLDAALSLVVSAKNAEGEPYIFDLPFQDSQATESLVFYTKNPAKVQLLFDIIPTYAGNREKIVGRAVALLSSVRTNVGLGRSSLQGGVTLPIIEGANLNVLGTISFEFTTVTPFEHANMNIGPNSTYWKSLITSRVIGHRGLGKNEGGRKSLQLGENTLASFIAAANLGASYVEMDVQLTKDNIPVIYHDFTVGETGIDAPMHSLTLEQVLFPHTLVNPVSCRQRVKSGVGC